MVLLMWLKKVGTWVLIIFLLVFFALYLSYGNYMFGFKVLYYMSIENCWADDIHPVISNILQIDFKKKVTMLLIQLDKMQAQCAFYCRNRDAMCSTQFLQQYCYILLQMLPFVSLANCTFAKFVTLVATYIVSLAVVISSDVYPVALTEKILEITRTFLPDFANLIGEYALLVNWQ